MEMVIVVMMIVMLIVVFNWNSYFPTEIFLNYLVLLFSKISLLLTSISSLSLGAFLVYKKCFLGLVFEQIPYFGLVLVYLLLIAIQAFFELIFKRPAREIQFLRSFLISISFALPWFLIFRELV